MTSIYGGALHEQRAIDNTIGATLLSHAIPFVTTE